MSLVIIAGRLGKDATIETTSGGTKMVKFSVVENEYRGGEEKTTWYDVTSFSPFIMEKQIKALKKGSFIVAPADLNVRPSFSKDGKLYMNYDAVVSSLKIVNVNGGRKTNEETSDTPNEEITTGTIHAEDTHKPTVKETQSRVAEQSRVVDNSSSPTVNIEVDNDVDDGDDLPF